VVKELTNYAVVDGNYNTKELNLNSNSVTTILTDNLDIIKIANKFVWATGNLRFRITVTNSNEGSLHDVIVNDILNPELIRLITDSITINGIPAGYGNFSYNRETGLLSIFLDTITSNQNIIIEFSVRKHRRQNFRLENYASLAQGGNTLLKKQVKEIDNSNESNIVIVNALSDVCKCREVYNNEFKIINQ